MSTTEKRLKSPTDADGTAVASVIDEPTDELSAFVQFFDAIEQLEDDCVLFGAASLEARVSRARVNRLRELAVAEWSKRPAA